MALWLGASWTATAQAPDSDQYSIALKRAAQLLRELTVRHPDRPEAFNNLAVVHARQGRLEQARDLLTRSINTHPSYATTFRNLNEVLAQLAAHAYKKALGDEPGESAPAATLALITTAVTPAPAAERVPASPVLASAEKAAPAAAPPLLAVASGATPAPTTTVPPARTSSPTTTVPQAATTAPAPAAAPAAAAVPPTTADPATPTERKSPDPRLAEVLSTLYGWARAWSDQDVGRYLSYYDRNFVPRRGLSRSAWQAQRQERVSRPSRIRVDVTAPSVTFDARDRAQVRFSQRYRSNRLDSTVDKTLTLRKSGGKWRITRERL
jgi:tetratricopeptide (TPR) repeat protein